MGTYDIFPTLCALANLQTPTTAQGRSFVTLFDNPNQSFRDAVYTRFGKGDAVVTDHLIYTRYGSDGEMLYDLQQDPQENHNIAAKPERQKDLFNMRGLLKTYQETASQAKVGKPRKHSDSEATAPNE